MGLVIVAAGLTAHSSSAGYLAEIAHEFLIFG
jgi:hypothetical protein